MEPFIEELSRIAPFYVGAYPNAGLPDPLSPTGFPETAESFAPKLVTWAANGWLNIVGGCCGTTPEHIRAIADRVRDCKPRAIPDAHASEPSGSARASRAGFRAPAETSSEIRYGKRNLPYFERPWSKYAVTFSTRNHRQLTPRERDIVFQSIVHGAEHNQYELYVACVMPDHVHLLFEPQVKEQDASGETIFWSMTEILQGIKSASAHRINKAAGAQGPIWENESFDRLIRSERDLQEKFHHIARNPWDANIVKQNEDYPWMWTPEISSARAPKTAREARALPSKDA
jgi:REP element-mobilizing transposase RayT